jgi:uncharacterized Fe-S cluster protein YjdI
MNDGPYRTPNPDELSDPPVRRAGFGGTVIKILLGLTIVVVIVALLLPSVRVGREPARRSSCANNLKQIGIALQNYFDDHRSFPPVYTVDADGNRLHSWRTLILPYLEHADLYETIDLSRPWDDPANAEAAKQIVKSYRCPSGTSPLGQTTYLAVVTPNSCLGPAPRDVAAITDEHSNTLMVIEVSSKDAVPWMSPNDADEAQVLKIAPSSKDLPHPSGQQALFVDGSVRTLSGDLSADQRRALISIAGNDDALAKSAN